MRLLARQQSAEKYTVSDQPGCSSLRHVWEDSLSIVHMSLDLHTHIAAAVAAAFTSYTAVAAQTRTHGKIHSPI